MRTVPAAAEEGNAVGGAGALHEMRDLFRQD